MATQQLPPFRYPTQNLEDVELIEDVPVRSSGMTASLVEASYGSPHPKSAAHLLVWQEPILGRDGALSIRRVYRKLPTPAMVGEAAKDSTWGAVASIVTQDVAAGTPADTGLNVIESVVEVKDAQISKKRTTTVQWPTLTSTRVNARGDLETVSESRTVPTTALPPATLATTELRLQAETQDRSRLVVGTVESHAQLIDKARGDAALIPARLRATETYETTDALVAPGSEPDALSATVIESKVAGKTRTQSVKRTTARTGQTLPSATDRKLGPQGELLEVIESLVNPGVFPAGAFGVASDAVRDTGTGVAVRTTTQLAPGHTYPALIRSAFAHEADGEEVTTTTQIVDPATAALPSGNAGILAARLEPIDIHHSRRVVTQLAANAFPILTGKSLEPETRTPVTVTRQIVPAGTALETDTALIIDQKIRAVDKWRSIRIITSLDALPAPYQEQKHLQFRFPGLFYNYDSSAGIVSYRHSISRVVSARVEVSFGYSKIEPVLFEINAVSWTYPLGFSVTSVLTNGEQFSYEKSEDVHVSVTVPLSTPTKAQYESLIGTHVTVTGASECWKGGVYRTELWKVKLE